MSASDVFTVLLSIGSSAGIGWLFRKWISVRLEASIRHEYETKRIQFEADVKQKANASLERLRSELSIEAARRTAEINRVHERRMELILDLGVKLYALRKAFVAYTAPMRAENTPALKELRGRVGGALDELDACLQPRRCFIPAPTLAKLEEFRTSVDDIAWEFMGSVEFTSDDAPRRETIHLRYETWEKARKFVVEESKALLADLHRDFEGILGIVDPPKKLLAMAADRIGVGAGQATPV